MITHDIFLSRRLHIRGHNGKIYPYLVVNDSGLADARREERVLQLLRMLNHLLGKHKETSRRFEHIVGYSSVFNVHDEILA